VADHEYIQGVARHSAVPSAHQLPMLAGPSTLVWRSWVQPRCTTSVAPSLPPHDTNPCCSCITCIIPCLLQVSKERDLLHSRLESLDAELERERGLHRRELARKAKEVQQVGTAACTCSTYTRKHGRGHVMASAELAVYCRSCSRWQWLRAAAGGAGVAAVT
jgi:hypothetical protein